MCWRSGQERDTASNSSRRIATVSSRWTNTPPPETATQPTSNSDGCACLPLGFGDESFDFVITFQVIEHIDDDAAFVREIARVLRPGGRMILTTPNAPMSLTRNPWHVREYRIDELRRLLSEAFSAVETHGVFGNERVMEYYEHNRRSVERIARFDLFDLQHRLPRRLLQLPYDLLNRINRRRLLRQSEALTTSIRMDDYRIAPGPKDVSTSSSSRRNSPSAT